MSKERYEPNGDELEALLAEVLENWELCAAISSSVRTRQALQERASQIQQGLINEMGGISTADIQSSFDHVSRARRKRNRRIKKDLGYNDAVCTALDWYLLGIKSPRLAAHPGWALVTEAMYDYLAITKRTELGSPVREVAINLLTTLRGDEAVDAATRTIDGVSAELS